MKSKFRILLPALTATLLATAATFATATADAQLTLSPAIVEAGSPELLSITTAPGTTSIDGTWLNHPLAFVHTTGNHWYALGGVDVEAAAGASELHVTAHLASGGTQDLSRTIEIHPGHYRTGSLTVAPKFVEPSPEALKQIESEAQLKSKIFTNSVSQPLWHGSFRAPVPAAPTDSFGTRRMFNGKLASVHKGMDFRAATGTPVRAANSGKVVLARPLYYEGNCVILDHGNGLYTLSMHLSRIDVHEGESVTEGQTLGLSGATGRVTGPHLHWAVRWQNAYLDPAKLLRLQLP